MPYASDAQRRYFHANEGTIGKKVVTEWVAVSNGIVLPAHNAELKRLTKSRGKKR